MFGKIIVQPSPHHVIPRYFVESAPLYVDAVTAAVTAKCNTHVERDDVTCLRLFFASPSQL